jgi:hypothetical protein
MNFYRYRQNGRTCLSKQHGRGWHNRLTARSRAESYHSRLRNWKGAKQSNARRPFIAPEDITF